MKPLASVLCALLVGLSACTRAPTLTVAQPPPVSGESLPITFLYNLPIVQATIGDPPQPVRLIVDLGGHDTVTLQSRVVDRLPMVHRTMRRAFSSRASGSISFDREIEIPELRLGSIVLTGIVGHQIDFNGPPELEQGADGYIGAGALRRFAMLVAYPDRISLFAPGSPQELPVHDTWIAVPFDERVTSSVSVNGIEVRAAWDTGASRTVIDRALARKIAGKDQESISAELSLNDSSFGTFDMPVLDLSGARVDVILGYSFFINHKVLFDFERNLALIGR